MSFSGYTSALGFRCTENFQAMLFKIFNYNHLNENLSVGTQIRKLHFPREITISITSQSVRIILSAP